MRAAATQSTINRLTTAPASSVRLLKIAFFLSLALVIVRMTMTDTVRPELIDLSGAGSPAVPGPASGLVLDLLCCLPALMVLANRVIRGAPRLRLTASHLPMLLLAAWTLMSATWAADKFAAIVMASHWAAALIFLWSTAQLVRDWQAVRIVAGGGFGLLLVLLVQGYYYRFVDLPDLQHQWREHHDTLLHDRGTALDSREATQIGRNIESGDVSGFSVSRNTYAAVIVLLGVLTAGIIVQRFSDHDGYGWIAPLIAIEALALLMLYRYVQSKTAYMTPLIAALALILIARRREWIGRNARKLFILGASGFVLMIVAVVSHGLYHGTLFHVSLTFRWQYWVGAARAFTHHPWIGVGWANFGGSYLAYRLPQAAEEPIDPHNFLVRGFVELGIIGGVLMIAWMAWMWWELTQRAATTSPEAEPSDSRKLPGLGTLVALAAGAMLLNAIVSIDWRQSGAWIFLELFKRFMFTLALIIGMAIVTSRSLGHPKLDQRPAPWILTALVVGLALFLLHNLIDFSIFETGPMFLFALLAGTASGLKMPRTTTTGSRAIAMGVLFAASLCWLTAGGAGVIPVVGAELLSQDAEADLHSGNAAAAVAKFVDAFQQLPINADYAYRAEQAAIAAHEGGATMRKLLDQAIAADPVSVKYRIARARVEAAQGNFTEAAADYAGALALDPNNYEMRLEYAGMLRNHNRFAEARLQYERALESNSRLAPDEIKRLNPQRLAQIQQTINALQRQ